MEKHGTLSRTALCSTRLNAATNHTLSFQRLPKLHVAVANRATATIKGCWTLLEDFHRSAEAVKRTRRGKSAN